jgi:hypothetical protein
VAAVVRCFGNVGYVVQQEPSDWRISADERELQRQLIDGWADAATAIAPGASSTIAGWRDRRIQHVEEGRSEMIVGHDDVGAWLPAHVTAG